MKTAAKKVQEFGATTSIEEGPEDLPYDEEQAEPVADQAAQRADAATRTAGERLIAAASYLRKHEDEAESAEDTATMEKVAGVLEQSGAYLRDQGLEGLGRPVARLIREHPLLWVLGACGVGYVMGLAAHDNRKG
jgi:hypothetical protein